MFALIEELAVTPRKSKILLFKVSVLHEHVISKHNRHTFFVVLALRTVDESEQYLESLIVVELSTVNVKQLPSGFSSRVCLSNLLLYLLLYLLLVLLLLFYLRGLLSNYHWYMRSCELRGNTLIWHLLRDFT